MRSYSQRYTGPGNGHVRREHKRVSVRFTDEELAEIRSLAVADNATLSEQIRTLCVWGMETLEDDIRATRQAQG